jgi:hypothetical protein
VVEGASINTGRFEVGSRPEFEPAACRLTAEQPTSSKLAGVGTAARPRKTCVACVAGAHSRTSCSRSLWTHVCKPDSNLCAVGINFTPLPKTGARLQAALSRPSR